MESTWLFAKNWVRIPFCSSGGSDFGGTDPERPHDPALQFDLLDRSDIPLRAGGHNSSLQ